MLLVGPRYLSTVGTPLRAGRDFGWADDAGTLKAAIVNEAFVRTYLGDDTRAVGRRFRSGDDAFELTIVGVARDVKYHGIRQATPPMVYLPFRQYPDPPSGDLWLHVRTATEPASLLPALRQQLTAVTGEVRLHDTLTQSELVDRSLFAERMLAWLSGAFGVLALGLACLGVYGVLAQMVTRRTKEIGIRMALGARRGDVLRGILGEVLRLLALGALVGLPASVTASRLLEGLLFGMQPLDIKSLALALGVLTVAALVAGWWPAWRAATVLPMAALREE